MNTSKQPIGDTHVYVEYTCDHWGCVANIEAVYLEGGHFVDPESFSFRQMDRWTKAIDKELAEEAQEALDWNYSYE
jgi:hypothetical protein